MVNMPAGSSPQETVADAQKLSAYLSKSSGVYITIGYRWNELDVLVGKAGLIYALNAEGRDDPRFTLLKQR